MDEAYMEYRRQSKTANALAFFPNYCRLLKIGHEYARKLRIALVRSSSHNRPDFTRRLANEPRVPAGRDVARQ